MEWKHSNTSVVINENVELRMKTENKANTF